MRSSKAVLPAITPTRPAVLPGRPFASRSFLVGAGSIALCLLCWEALSRLELVSRFLFPAPSMVAAGLYELGTRGFPEGIPIYRHASVTLQRIGVGFAGAALVGVPLGVVIGYFAPLDRLTHALVTFGRSIAAISLLPLFIAWFGIGEFSKIMLLGLGAFWIVLTYTIAGVKFVDPILLRVARSMDTPAAAIFAQVILPAALPRIFTGLKVALGACFMIIVAAEMIATVEGLGALVMEARNAFRTDITMAGMLVIGLLGWLASRLLDLLERALLPWRTGTDET